MVAETGRAQSIEPVTLWYEHMSSKVHAETNTIIQKEEDAQIIRPQHEVSHVKSFTSALRAILPWTRQIFGVEHTVSPSAADKDLQHNTIDTSAANECK